MRIKTLPLIVGALAFALGGGVAHAFPLFPGTGLIPGTQFEDDDIDYFHDSDAAGTPGFGLITVGDVLIAPIEMTRVIDILPPLDAGSPYATNQAADELVALATIVVIPNLPGDPAGRIRFGQFGATPMIQVFSGGPLNLDVLSDPTEAAATAAATDGTFLWAFSITADPDTEWFFDPVAGLPANNPGAVALITAGTKVGAANFALNQVAGTDIFNPEIIACGLFGCAGDGLVDLSGSADLLGGLGLANGAFARSDADVVVNPIPEPATLGLLGIGLLGLAAIGRRSLQKST